MMAAAALLAVLAAGPGAAAPVLAPSVARPGDAVLVRLRVKPGAPAPEVALAGRPLQFWAHGGERWALAALPLETTPGSLRLELAAGASEAARSTALTVVEPGFPSRTLQVAPQFVEPPADVKAQIESDRLALDAAYARPFGPPLFSTNFGWPRRARTNGRFGDQRIFNGKKESVHYGLDIQGPRGAPVLAANDGEVVLARNCYYSGNTVVLWHGADLFTLYFHLDRIDVQVGAKVRKGARLGRIGSTGRSTGPHLHWSARVAGLLVDPESLLGIDFRRGAAPPRHAGSPPRSTSERTAAAAPGERAGSVPAAARRDPAPRR